MKSRNTLSGLVWPVLWLDWETHSRKPRLTSAPRMFSPPVAILQRMLSTAWMRHEPFVWFSHRLATECGRARFWQTVDDLDDLFDKNMKEGDYVVMCFTTSVRQTAYDVDSR